MFKTSIPVQIGHINYGNHLGHDSLVSILHEARLQWLKSLSPDVTELTIENTTGLMIKELNVVYKSEAQHGDVLDIELWLDGHSKSTIILNYRVDQHSSGKQVASARTVIVFYDRQKNRVARIPKIILGIE